VPAPPGIGSTPAQMGQAIAEKSRATGGLPRPPGLPPSVPNPNPAPGMAGHDMSAMAGAGVQQAGYTAFPRDKVPSHVMPSTPVPPGMSFDESLIGDAERGRAFVSQGGGGCLACHTIAGNPVMVGVIGPNLTHIGSRSTIAGGIFPNDKKYMSLWIKNSRWMKPGVIMPTLGAFQRDPVTGQTVPKTGLTDQQIADITAYMHALK